MIGYLVSSMHIEVGSQANSHLPTHRRYLPQAVPIRTWKGAVAEGLLKSVPMYASHNVECELPPTAFYPAGCVFHLGNPTLKEIDGLTREMLYAPGHSA